MENKQIKFTSHDVDAVWDEATREGGVSLSGLRSFEERIETAFKARLKLKALASQEFEVGDVVESLPTAEFELDDEDIRIIWESAKEFSDRTSLVMGDAIEEAIKARVKLKAAANNVFKVSEADLPCCEQSGK